MKMKLWIFILFGLLAVCSAKKEEPKDAKDKRQIRHQTRVIPNQAPAGLYNHQQEQPAQFLIRSLGHSQPSPTEQHLRHSQPERSSLQQEQTQETSPESYAYIQDIPQAQLQKAYEYGKAAPRKGYPVQHQYIPTGSELSSGYGQDAPILITEEQIIKILQEELAARGIPDLEEKPVSAPKTSPTNATPTHQTAGLGQYRESHPVENVQPFNYIPQLYQQSVYSHAPITYHKNIPNHPLAESTLEKELEKLVASNKPSLYERSKQEQFKPIKTEERQYSQATTKTSQTNKPYSFLPEYGQYSPYKPLSLPFIRSQYSPQQFPYGGANFEIDAKYSKANGQYLAEVAPKQKSKTNHTPFQHKSHYYIPEAKEQRVQSELASEGKNNAMKIIQAPALQYEKPQAATSAAIQKYYKDQATEKQSAEEQSQSSIFVSQSTGISQQNQQHSLIPNKAYAAEKPSHAFKLSLPEDRPLTQEEFQALVDAGYPVQAVPVPVPVPFEKYIKDHPEYLLQQEQPEKSIGQQTKIGSERQGVTYLRPVHLQHQHQHSPNAKAPQS